MIHVDARYLGLTANQLADIATDLKAENDRLQEQNAELLKLLEDMKNAPCCGDYCWMELPKRLRDAGIEVPS